MSAPLLHHPLTGETSATAKPKEPVSGAADKIVGRTGWDLLGGIAEALKRPVVALPVLLCLIVGMTTLALSGYARVTNKDGRWVLEVGPPSEAPGPVVQSATRSLERLIAAGHELKRPYVLDDVAIQIRLDEVMNGQNRERHVNWRITYTVRALQQISRTDKLFKERYSTSSASIRRWFGSEKEIKATDDAYNVMMDIPAGETRTIVTGATFVYALPLSNNRHAFSQHILLASDQEFFSYPNDEDVVGEITLIIESDTVKFSPVGQAAKRSKPDGSIAPDEEFRFNVVDDRRSLSAYWKDVVPKEEVGLHFKVE